MHICMHVRAWRLYALRCAAHVCRAEANGSAAMAAMHASFGQRSGAPVFNHSFSQDAAYQCHHVCAAGAVVGHCPCSSRHVTSPSTRCCRSCQPPPTCLQCHSGQCPAHTHTRRGRSHHIRLCHAVSYHAMPCHCCVHGRCGGAHGVWCLLVLVHGHEREHEHEHVHVHMLTCVSASGPLVDRRSSSTSYLHAHTHARTRTNACPQMPAPHAAWHTRLSSLTLASHTSTASCCGRCH